MTSYFFEYVTKNAFKCTPTGTNSSEMDNYSQGDCKHEFWQKLKYTCQITGINQRIMHKFAFTDISIGNNCICSQNVILIFTE